MWEHIASRLQGKRAAENTRRRRLQGEGEGEKTGEEYGFSEEEAQNGWAHQEVGVASLPEWGVEGLDKTMDGLR